MSRTTRRGVRATLAAFLGVLASANADAGPLVVKRLAWAGVQLELGDTTLLIDPVTSPGALGGIPPVPVEVRTPRRYVLLTHLHNDHYDRALIPSLLGDRGRVVCVRSMAADVASDGLRLRSVALFEATSLGPFTVIPVPAQDGVGDEQVSWIVLAGAHRLVHAGDTLWHGAWQRLGAQYGPFDLAFLPINAALLGEERPPRTQPISMSPEQAATAALQLRARKLCPIHYGRQEPDYVEFSDAPAALKRAASTAGLDLLLLQPGERSELAARP